MAYGHERFRSECSLFSRVIGNFLNGAFQSFYFDNHQLHDNEEWHIDYNHNLLSVSHRDSQPW